MKNAGFRCALAVAGLILALPSMPGSAAAEGLVSPGRPVALSCENGRTYPLRIRAVSDYGEIVTGYLSTSPRHAVHVRLIPMGDGYRYAGRGLWFDGKGDLAVLYFGVRSAVNCTVLRDDDAVVSVKG